MMTMTKWLGDTQNFEKTEGVQISVRVHADEEAHEHILLVVLVCTNCSAQYRPRWAKLKIKIKISFVDYDAWE